MPWLRCSWNMPEEVLPLRLYTSDPHMAAQTPAPVLRPYTGAHLHPPVKVCEIEGCINKFEKLLHLLTGNLKFVIISKQRGIVCK